MWNLLVDGIELFRLLLGNVEPDRQVIVVFNQPLDCTASVLEVSTECFTLFS